MPAIFKGENRTRAKTQMYEIGFKLIKKYGIKKTVVEDITRETGIAKGTFYNFFETKETFIYEIIEYQREKIKAKFNKMIADKGSLSKEDIKKILNDLTFDGNNLFYYLDDEDMTALELKLPKSTSTRTFDESIALMLVNGVKREDSKIIDYRILSNYITILSLTNIHKDKMNKEAFKATVDSLIDTITNIVLG